MSRFTLPRICVAVAIFAVSCPFSPAKEPEFRFEKDVANYERISRETPPPEGCTMFVGSSTWTGWGKTFAEDFRDMKAVNRGFGGSRIPDWLRVMDRLVTPHKPARILFFCGTNDLAGKAEPEKVFADFRTFLDRLWKDNPECRVYFVSASHAPVRKDIWLQMDRLNGMVVELTKDEPRLRYIDINTAMADENGDTKEEYFQKDRLHLNRKGQEVWIPIIRKAVLEEEESKSPR